MEHWSSPELSRVECDRLLAANDVARLAATSGAMPIIFPVRYAMLGGDPVFRTVQGGRLHRASLDQVLCLEIDHFGLVGDPGWSVVVIGKGSAVNDPAVIDACEQLTPTAWWSEPQGDAFVRLQATVVNGRRLDGLSPTLDGFDQSL